MKNILTIILCSTMLLTSCGNNQSSNESEDSGDFKEAKNCEEFITNYEKWMEDYIILIDKYMKNPMDATLMQDYLKIAEESMSWMNEWNTTLSLCASKKKYEKRFEEITERAEEKLKEMGIE